MEQIRFGATGLTILYYDTFTLSEVIKQAGILQHIILFHGHVYQKFSLILAALY